MKPLSYYTGKKLYRALQPLKKVSCIRRAYNNSRYLVHVCADCLPYVFWARLRNQDSSFIRQALSSYKTNIPASSSAQDIIGYLSGSGIRYHEGRHTFYVPPQRGLDLVIGGFVNSYPANAGFKVLKNIGSGENHTYLHATTDPYPWALRALLGSPTDVFDGACLAEVLGLGPRAYDLATLSNGSMRLTCYVVQHVAGQVPSQRNCHLFINKLKGFMDQGILALALPEGLECGDFAPPDCNNNLIQDETGRCYYVDFQHFILKDRKKLLSGILEDAIQQFHFGQPHFLTHKSFLYQEIPGVCSTAKRDTIKRWSVIKGLLNERRISLKDKVILDICCNSGIMLGCALSEGAFWGLGWDLPEVAHPANHIQRLLGNTRLDILGSHLHEDYALTQSISSHLRPRLGGCIVLYLAASQHIGFLNDLASIPWKALVYEGHESDRAEKVASDIDKVERLWKCRLAVRRTIRDGHCGARPLALLVRS